jgi:glutaredoxin-like YruB-family protein
LSKDRRENMPKQAKEAKPAEAGKKVKVYSTPTCPYCKMAKDYLTQNNIKFEHFDVATDEKARNEMVQRSGQMGVPVIDVNGQIIVGFDKEKLKKALNLK